MKKGKIILFVIAIILGTGCGAPKTELDKFKSYLIKNVDYKCAKNICRYEKKVGKIISFRREFNFDENLFTNETDGNNGLNTSKTIYNWYSNTSTYETFLLGIKINSSYNHNTDEFNCNSDYEDKEFVDTECKLAEKHMKEFRDYFNQIIENSETKYFVG